VAGCRSKREIVFFFQVGFKIINGGSLQIFRRAFDLSEGRRQRTGPFIDADSCASSRYRVVCRQDVRRFGLYVKGHKAAGMEVLPGGGKEGGARGRRRKRQPRRYCRARAGRGRAPETCPAKYL
jgi:hypothetical protein